MMRIIKIAVIVLSAFIFSGYAFTQDNSAKSSGIVFDTQNLKSITELKLSGKEIKTLPGEIFEMENLKVLDISNNELDELPSEIKNLKNLKILIMNGNNLYELPEELSRLKFLKEIYLDYSIWCFRVNEIKKVTKAKIFLVD